jgi:hypothetical protein
MGLDLRTIDAHERSATTGLVQAVVWDAAFERWLLDDPERLLRPDLHRAQVLRIDPWRPNKIVANHVAGFGNGLNLFRDYLAGDAPPFPTHVAWGTNGTAPALADVGLYAEKARTSLVARVKSDKQLTIAGFMGSTTGNGETFREAALVNELGATRPIIFARIAHNDIAKNVNVLISVSWQIDLA